MLGNSFTAVRIDHSFPNNEHVVFLFAITAVLVAACDRLIQRPRKPTSTASATIPAVAAESVQPR